MSTKSVKRRLRRHKIHHEPTEAMVQKVVRLQKRLGKVIAASAAHPPPMVVALVKELERAEDKAPEPTAAERKKERALRKKMIAKYGWDPARATGYARRRARRGKKR